jgi:CubicO group peptidase (beta-lactamase class C family)
MTTDHLTPEQRRSPSALAFLDGSGWGYGVQVLIADKDTPVRMPRYGWGGGLGTLWYSWPDQRTATVLLTQVLPPTRELITAVTAGLETALGL